MKYNIIILSLIIFSQIFAQPFYLGKRISNTVLFPDYKLFPSNFSDPLEAKTGVQLFLDDKSLLLNIGGSKDLIHHRLNFWNKLAFGIEFFNWNLLHREKQFRFPVIANDYFFGGYFVFYHQAMKLDWINRLRISHISSHLSDGSFDKSSNQWVNNQLPFTYSREFLQWTSTFVYQNIKLYLDAIYLFHSIPDWKFNTIAGLGSEAIIVDFQKLHTKIFSGFDLKLQRISNNKFEANKNFSTGLIFGNEKISHLRLAYQFYSGYNFLGQFYNNKFTQSFLNLSLVF